MGHVLFGQYSINTVLEKYMKHIKTKQKFQEQLCIVAPGMCYLDSILNNVLLLITSTFIQTQRTQFHMLMFSSS